jgi:pimeloyl-ACP methyl ester carboxylesterase
VWQDAVQLLDALVQGPVHFCGLSMGGFVAMRTAARRPDLVRSLILLETSADPEPMDNVPRYRLLNRVTRLLGSGVTRARVAPIMLGKTILADKARRADVDRFAQLMSRRRDIWRAVNGVVDRGGIYHELSRITAPTLVLVGEEDVATPRVKAERIAGAIAGAKLVTIPRAGHSSPVEEPERVTAAIEQFLNSVTPTRS